MEKSEKPWFKLANQGLDTDWLDGHIVLEHRGLLYFTLLLSFLYGDQDSTGLLRPFCNLFHSHPVDSKPPDVNLGFRLTPSTLDKESWSLSQPLGLLQEVCFFSDPILLVLFACNVKKSGVKCSRQRARAKALGWK